MSRVGRRAATLAAIGATALTVALLTAPAALAAAGGGSANFGGGGGGGFGGGGGGHGFGGGGHGKGFAIYLIFRAIFDFGRIGHGLGFLVLLAIALAVYFYLRVLPRLRASMEARREHGREHRRSTAKRSRRVELAAAEASEEDPAFAPEAVREAAESLYASIQSAWTRDDRIALRGIVAPSLLAEWERRLDDLRARGWSNHVEVLEPPQVQYVGLQNRGDAEDQVTVRIDARIRDYVVDRQGRHIKRSGHFTETVRTREFWTLQKRGDHWILASVESGGEGARALQEKLVATPWSDDERLRDEALVEGAVAEAVPEGTRIAEVADLQFDGDARAAANDLSLADGRFAPDVLEVAARRAVAAWAQAVDGDDHALREIAERDAVRELLHPGDPSGRTRLVVRRPVVRQIRVHALDAGAEPPTMTLDVDLAGRRYIQDRDTAAVVAGSPTHDAEFTERWTLALTGRDAQPWRLIRVDTPVGQA